MLTALILICSIASTPDIAACNQSNAVDMMKVPDEYGNPMTCFMHGQAFLAQTELGRDITENERVKILCVQSRKATAQAIPR